MKKWPKTAAEVHANRGIEAKYRKALDKLINEMIHSFDYWITAAYRKNPPLTASLVAQDALPAKEMNRALKGLGKRWIKKFDEVAAEMAIVFSRSMQKSTDKAFEKSLKDAGFTIEFTMTPTMRDTLDAVIAENVSLIKSIPREYLTDVEGITMRAFTKGNDLGEMTKELRARYGITQRRAATISRDQSSKLNSAVQRDRQLEIGITEAEWRHSGAGKVPRPDHVAAHGKRYNIAKGALISGEYILPGEEINCRCTSRSILPF